MGILFLCSVESQRSTNMQLHIRGSSNYVLEFSGAESLAELKAKVAECDVPKMSFFTLLASLSTTKWLSPALVNAMSMSPFPLWEERCTVPWLVPERSVVKPPKLKPKRRKRRRPDVPRGGSNTTDASLTLSRPSAADVDLMPTRKVDKYE